MNILKQLNLAWPNSLLGIQIDSNAQGWSRSGIFRIVMLPQTRLIEPADVIAAGDVDQGLAGQGKTRPGEQPGAAWGLRAVRRKDGATKSLAHSTAVLVVLPGNRRQHVEQHSVNHIELGKEKTPREAGLGLEFLDEAVAINRLSRKGSMLLSGRVVHRRGRFRRLA
jgi:hypothetical protein